MSPAFHIFVSLAGAVTFGAAGAAWSALSGASFEAGALTMIHSGATAPDSLALGSLRAMVVSEPVLRRAALRPEAAAIVEKCARPTGVDRLAALLRSRPPDLDTLSRAAAMLAPRIDLRPGPLPDTFEILARMPNGGDAAAVATAVAESFVVEINEIGEKARKRAAQAHGERLDQAAHRLEEARNRVQAARAIDPIATASIASTREKPAGDAQPGLEPLQRAAAETTARLAQASRIYGPRHPLLIEAETVARRAQTALKAAQGGARKITTAPAPNLAEGGPDPRADEILTAEAEAARAKTAYDLEMARSGADRREARVLKPAPVPIRSNAPSSLAIVGGSALLGFLLMGAAPLARMSKSAATRRLIVDRRLARLRDGALDWVAAERVLEILGIGDGRTARIVKVVGDDVALAGAGAKALALAALAAGWRPLLVSGSETAPEGPRRPIALAGAIWFARKTDTCEGPLCVASPTERASADPGVNAIDAALAFDFVVIDTGLGEDRRVNRMGGRADWIVRVAADLSDPAATDLIARFQCEADCFAGTLLSRETPEAG